MSEFQQYEFMAIDRPLSGQQQAEVSNWSSRTTASSHRAMFTYHYGDFPKNERAVVLEYFDAMLYTANWGSTRLIFKFPASVVNVRQLGQYSVEGLDVLEKADTVMIDISLHEEEGYDRWLDMEDGELSLSSLVSLRNDIMAGDYRCLYLVWLKVSLEEAQSEWGDVDPESKEPPLPAGLHTLDGALATFVDVFGIAPDMIEAAAAGAAPATEGSIDYAAEIDRWPDDRKNDFLRRLLANEPLLHVKLAQALEHTDSRPNAWQAQPQRRTVEQLLEQVATKRDHRTRQAQKKQEAQRVARLEDTERRAHFLWLRVDTLIEEKNARSYDDAIRILQELKELAVYRGQYSAFNERVKEIRENYSRRSSLKQKIDLASLIDAH